MRISGGRLVRCTRPSSLILASWLGGLVACGGDAVAQITADGDRKEGAAVTQPASLRLAADALALPADQKADDRQSGKEQARQRQDTLSQLRSGMHTMYDPSLHLFVDDYHIRNIFAMKRVFGRPVKHPQPVLRDIPGRMVGWACVLREPDGKFRAWYLSCLVADLLDMWKAGVWGKGEEFGYFPVRHARPVPETMTAVVSYAESADGINWNKPELGLIEWRGNKRNNIVLDSSVAARQYDGALTNMDAPSVIHDDEEADPNKRYKLICHWETFHIYDNFLAQLNRSEEYLQRMKSARAKYLTTSPDGIHWDAPVTRIKGCAGGGDYSGVTRDERNSVYWFNDRGRRGVPDVSFRSAGLCTSKDLYHWPETVEQVLILGEFEDYGRRWEHHGMVPFNYGDQDLGFVELCLSTKGDWKSILVTHRDGQRWQFANDHESLLDLGKKGSFDDSVLVATRNPPFRMGDRLHIYYNGRHYYDDNTPSEGYLCLATLRLDGFAGMTVDEPAVQRLAAPAKIQTQLLEIREDQLQVNIQGHRGSAKVALQYETAYPVEGCAMEDCLPIDEDNVRAVVRWKNRKDLRDLKGRKVFVLIQLSSGTIWSVRL